MTHILIIRFSWRHGMARLIALQRCKSAKLVDLQWIHWTCNSMKKVTKSLLRMQAVAYMDHGYTLVGREHIVIVFFISHDARKPSSCLSSEVLVRTDSEATGVTTFLRVELFSSSFWIVCFSSASVACLCVSLRQTINTELECASVPSTVLANDEQ